MDKIQASFISNSSPLSLKRGAVQGEPLRQDLPVSRTKAGLQISAEAQYLFEMDKYLSELDQVTQNGALEYLSKSDNSLLKGVSDYFRKSQKTLDRALGEDRTLTLDRTGSDKAKKLLDVGFELNDSTEIAVIPLATKVFRLDGNDSFYPVKLNARNDAANNQLDALEKAASGILGNQDSANLFGSVRNALSASENILLSFDDALHLTYSIEKARTAIDSIEAPESIKSELTGLLNQSIDYQNDKQSRFLRDTAGFTTDNRIGNIASGDVRMGTAAQKFNSQLQEALAATGSSIFSARGLADQLLTQHTDLIRFGQDKVDEAFSFYEDDFTDFKKFLNKDFSDQPESQALEIGGSIHEVGKKFAESVIAKINNYLHG